MTDPGIFMAGWLIAISGFCIGAWAMLALERRADAGARQLVEWRSGGESE